ncbi:SusC/RagA family TonB-linked outer membrane protein [Chitinophaga sancti]|uniref:Iron complex outermembrane recepter protein n=1 Tax=Chitinophaga sancti TaxID=1004 RepID=A0A1K1PUT9_9BACT|nr:SusC/RagA family TonB-linked outer membrane protein [Chitinophaga sancti]WQD61595.1 SusC/RagA family TonB-linked outer membrane protein [Chitinophaga sancti]WQG92848.1 SusC/RagA family TonB-linked outer membrane protein [Chitinophaga sancti]SFW51490.1 iron complex outermembrane recepter protein [Chitinophaga sancti]
MRRSLLVSTLLLLFCCFTALAQDKKVVSGTVKDDKGAPVPGVTVVEKGTKNGIQTAPDGTFKLSVGPNATLIISYVGYAKQEIAVAGQSTINTTLAVDNKGLNEVVVTAMGIKREARALGYSVSTVNAKDLTQSGSPSFSSALYGKAAGVKVVAAPGGASSGVAIQVRGVSSVSLNTQPLYVVDGVPIRNFADPTKSSFNTTNNRIDGNGALDINPEDIETLTVLKGASASALYGSEATNGVIVITTKKGIKGRGLGVDMNYSYTAENLQNSPDYQTEFGPGYEAQTNVANGATAEGWIADSDGTLRPYYRAYGQFGPKYDGRTVRYWDGSTKTYSAQKNNYRSFFQTGYNSMFNVAVSNSSDIATYRFSYSRNDYKAILPGSNLNKNNFNLNATLRLHKKVTLDIVSTFNNNFTHNRPQSMTNLFSSYDGFFSRMDDMDAYKTRYQTSHGYKYVRYNESTYDQDEKFRYNIRAYNLLDYLYTQLRNSYDENQNRFINSATLTYSILDNLKFRGRIGNDFTNWKAENKEHNQVPTYAGTSGKYGVEQRTNSLLYGDAMLTYNPKIGKNFDLGVSGGFTGRKQNFQYGYNYTTVGLGTENWFSLTNSAGTLGSESARGEQIDIAGFGIVNLSYKGWLYLEGTGRTEKTSTLPKGANSYTYPSVNAGFVFSDVFKMPTWFNYGKLRTSYGLTGNHPTMYMSPIAFTQYGITIDGNYIAYQQPNASTFGNEGLRSEQKREFEFGLETRILDGKVGVDLTYYNNKIKDQILTATTPMTAGAGAQIVNAGDLSNYGFEGAINATPIQNKNFRWNTRFNFAINRNKLTRLAPIFPNITNDLEGGYVIARSEVGDPLGNLYVHPHNTDANGNYIVDKDAGIYTYNTDKYIYAGNVMPKIVGGFSNTFTYKAFSVDVTLDYRFGGKLVSIPSYYAVGAGMFKSTLQYRDAARGGLPYAVVSDKDGNYAPVAAGQPGDRQNGVILEGVTDEAGTKNSKIIDAGTYYRNQFGWHSGDYTAAIFNNNYIKVREVSATYTMPKKIVDKLHFQGLQVSLVARNLFYIHKSLPYGLDPESATGSSWLDQGQDKGALAPTRSFGASLRARF